MREHFFIRLECATPGVDAVAARSRYSFSRHTHEEYGIGVMEQGAHRSHSGRGQVEAGPGDAITVNPGEVHDGAPIGGAGRSWRILYLDPALIDAAAMDIFGMNRGTFEFSNPVVHNREISELTHGLYAVETEGRGDAMPREELLLRLLARAGGPTQRHPPPPPAPILRARERIDDNPAAPTSLTELAAISGISRFQLVRGFARSTGMTPHAYLVQRRTDVARRLIRGGSRLAEAASLAGFADQSHMTRTFVRKYGLTPSAFSVARR